MNEIATHLRTLADELDAGGLFNVDALPPAVDGPFPPGFFRWAGRTAPLAPVPFDVLCLVWKSRARTIQCYAVEDSIWGTTAPPDGLRGALVKVNRALESVAYPMRLRKKGSYLHFVNP